MVTASEVVAPRPHCNMRTDTGIARGISGNAAAARARAVHVRCVIVREHSLIRLIQTSCLGAFMTLATVDLLNRERSSS